MIDLRKLIKPLPYGSHKVAGKNDNASRWYPSEEYMVPSSFNVRSPSRNWPSSYFKHFYSLKYARLLFEHRPDLYFELHGLNTSFLEICHEKLEALVSATFTKRIGV